MLRNGIFFCLLFLLVSCTQQKPGDKMTKASESAGDSKLLDFADVEQVKNLDIDGNTEEFQRKTEDYAKHGSYVKYGPNGQIMEEAFYINDTLHGSRVLYYENADTQIVETYDMGIFEGPFLAFYDNGQLELHGEYRNNITFGQWKKYYRTGELMEVVTFENNEENGPFIEYYQNGNIKAEGEYLNGVHEHGLLKLYNEEGELIKKMECEKGICKTIWEKGKENIGE